MITIIKNFSIFRGKETDNEKLPSHKINTKIGDSFVEIGSCWTKEGKNGKYLSGRLATAYINERDRTKSRKAVVMVFEEDLVELFKKVGIEYDLNEPPKA